MQPEVRSRLIAPVVSVALVSLMLFGCAAGIQRNLVFQGAALVRANGQVIIVHDRQARDEILGSVKLPQEDIALLTLFEDPCDAHKCVVVGEQCMGTERCKECSFTWYRNSIGSLAYGCCCALPGAPN